MGPEKLFSATVVRMVGTPKLEAAREIRAALLRSRMGVDRLGGKGHLRLEIDQDQRVISGREQRLPGVGVAVRVIGDPCVEPASLAARASYAGGSIPVSDIRCDLMFDIFERTAARPHLKCTVCDAERGAG
jgi:hypothetical protein